MKRNKKRLFYATKNKFKIQNMKDRLNGVDIEIVTPYDLNLSIEIEENGTTVIENAISKAKGYYKEVGIATIAADSSLFIEKFDKQPGLFIRRQNGKYLDDDALEKYYIDELNKVGGKSDAYYITGLAIINNDKLDTIEIKEDKVILTSDICRGKRNNNALGRLEYDPKVNKYSCEMTEEDKKKRNYTFDKQCIDFIMKNI